MCVLHCAMHLPCLNGKEQKKTGSGQLLILLSFARSRREHLCLNVGGLGFPKLQSLLCGFAGNRFELRVTERKAQQ